MTPQKYDSQYAIDRLRALVRRWGSVNETMCQRFTLRELCDLDRMWMLSGWDFYPDQWTERQVREALKGRPPQWDDDERPKYEREQEPDERSAQDWKEHAE